MRPGPGAPARRGAKARSAIFHLLHFAVEVRQHPHRKRQQHQHRTGRTHRHFVARVRVLVHENRWQPGPNCETMMCKYTCQILAPSPRAALTCSVSAPGRPARNMAITNPAVCHTAAITTQQMAIWLSLIQPKAKLSQPSPWMERSSPTPGTNISFQAVPVQMKDTALGYKNTG